MTNLYENEPNNRAEYTKIIGNSGSDPPDLRPSVKLRLLQSSRTHEIEEEDDDGDLVHSHDDPCPSIDVAYHRHIHRQDVLCVSPEIKTTSSQEERMVMLEDLDVLQIMVDPSDELRLPPDRY